MFGDYRKRTPLPIPEREARSRGSGPVITYKLSPEELEKYRSMPGAYRRGQDGKKINPPVIIKTNFTVKEEDEDMPAAEKFGYSENRVETKNPKSNFGEKWE